MYCTERKNILIAGVDEVGCGSLVGSVVAAAVILNPNKLISGLADSKVLSNGKRNILYKDIIKYALAWSFGSASAIEIDKINILQARLLAMQRAIYNLSIVPDLVLIDGNYAPTFYNIPYQCIKRGDTHISVISAASIIAKVKRDNDMIILHAQYPVYNLAQNKGYPTCFHLQQLMLHGPSLYHRKSFAPVKYMV